MVDPMHFDAHADDYARARPPYPPELWDRVRGLGVLRPGRRALDLGAGTGLATGRLLAEGLHVTAVEPGRQLAARLSETFPEATVLVERAEDLELPGGSFDLVVAATSIHWMDLDVVPPTVHRLLAPGGRFLVWRNVFGDPAVGTPFRERVTGIVARRGGPPRPGPNAEEIAATSAALTATGNFAVDETAVFRWSIELDEAQVRGLFTTFSDWSADEVDQAGRAVRDLGGRVVEHYLSWLIVLSPLDVRPGGGR